MSSHSSFDMLSRGIRRWIRRQGWTKLLPIQDQAIPLILGRERDVLIAAPTAGGKTEAAFFPIATALDGQGGGSIRALCISPLKALINDQYERLVDITQDIDLNVHRWHGDVSQSRKAALKREPNGILLITPESLEAWFVNNGLAVIPLLQRLEFLVVDELHVFIGSERGKQVQSQLARLEQLLQRPIPRIGLSATIGNLADAKAYLRPHDPANVQVIEDDQGGLKIKLKMYGFQDDPDAGDTAEVPTSQERIAGHLFEHLRGEEHLVFTNRRQDVESYTARLRDMCEEQSVPNEFFAHHGNLSKGIREDVETRLKGNLPTIVFCTSTLELGIDIGGIDGTVQVGVPPSVSSIRQRLGRSGRRNGVPAMRLYLVEQKPAKGAPLSDSLREATVQTTAMIELLRGRWYEPPIIDALHGSTLVQQFLSLTAQFGGVAPLEAWRRLCGDGAFSNISQDMFVLFLKALKAGELITQCGDGSIILDLKGERLLGHRRFYAAFETPEEWRLQFGSKLLGTVPFSQPIMEDIFLIFAGRNWRVKQVNPEKRVAELEPAFGGKPPRFQGGGFDVHDQVRRKMYQLFTSEEEPVYLDEMCRNFLKEGREAFKSFGLSSVPVLAEGGNLYVFPWRGDRVLTTLLLILRSLDWDVGYTGCILEIQNGDLKKLHNAFKNLAAQPPWDAVQLAETVPNLIQEKHDRHLPRELLVRDYAAKHLDTLGAHEVIQKIHQAVSGEKPWTSA